MLLGGLEKVMKAKRQKNAPPPPPQPYDDFEDVEQPSAEPQTLEELMRRMMRSMDTEEAASMETIPVKEAQSLEAIDDSPHFHYQPIVTSIEKESALEDGTKGQDFVFDIRQAVIASEILNRKY